MLVKRILSGTYRISDVNVIYAKDIKNAISMYLKTQLVDKCIHQCLVQDVTRIVNMAPLTSQTRNDGSMNCSVEFEVDCIIANRMELIPNCRVLHRDVISDNVICETDHVVARLKGYKYASILKANQLIPIIVGKSLYKIGSNKISMVALPFVPLPEKIDTYSVTITQDDDVDACMKRLVQFDSSKYNIKVFEYFTKLLPKYKKLTKVNAVELSKVIAMRKTVNITLNDDIDMSKHMVTIVPGELLDKQSYTDIMCYIINKFIRHNEYIDALCTAYPTMKDVEKNKNIWDTYIDNRM